MTFNWKIGWFFVAALNVIDLSHGERPSDYQRKFSGRTLWKTIHTDVEELLPLPSYNRDTAVQESVSSGSKVAALQQLLRWAPDAIQEGRFDKCKHPLHSWMCQKTVVRSTPPPTTTTTPKPEEPRFPDASNVAERKLIPTTAPSKPYTRKPVQDADLCSNPFHSWRCNPEQNPEASNLAEKQLIPEVTTTPAPKPPTKKPSGWDGVDPCTHAFHSWLCKPAPRPRKLPPPVVIPSQPEASNTKESIETIYIPPPPEQEASNSEDSSTLLYIPPPRATDAPQASYIPPPPSTEATESTYLPPPPSTEAPEIYLPPPPSTEAPEVYLPPPPSTEAPEVYLPPPPSTEAPEVYLPPPSSTAATEELEASYLPPLEPASSNRDGNQLIPDATAEPKQRPTKSGWEGADPCSHPFHSWLCNRSGNAATPRSSWKRIGRQSTPWVVDDSDDIIYAWANFEPKRISVI